MKVLVPTLSGFCPGVKRAEREIFGILRNNPGKKICVLGELIHNTNYMIYLENNGLSVMENPSDLSACDIVVIRTHGIERGLEEELEKKFNLVNLTCKKVKNLQQVIQEKSDDDYFIVISGRRDHPEVQGLVSYAKEFVVIDGERFLNEIMEIPENLADLITGKGYSKVLITSQTTASSSFFSRLCDCITKSFSGKFLIECHNSICGVTQKKEQEALSLQKESDVTLVIGDKKSSNAKKLFQVLSSVSGGVYFVEDLTDFKAQGIDLRSVEKVLVVSSASTPKFIEDEIISYLESL